MNGYKYKFKCILEVWEFPYFYISNCYFVDWNYWLIIDNESLSSFYTS